MKYYTVYKITNQINGKYYIGRHITSNLYDNYMGSGQVIKTALQKYGKKNFIKQVLEIYNNESDMILAEKILVVPDKETNYNLVSGGIGGESHKNPHYKEDYIWVTNGSVNKKIKKYDLNKYILNGYYSRSLHGRTGLKINKILNKIDAPIFDKTTIGLYS